MKYFYFLKLINLFSTNVPLLYPLKSSENQTFSDVFRGYRSGLILIENGLRGLAVAQEMKRLKWKGLLGHQNT